MSDDLVKRLRSCANGAWLFNTKQGDFGICDDAADRIEALTAERDAQHEAWQQAMLEFDKKCKEANKHYARAEAAEADNARLRAELTTATHWLEWTAVHLETVGALSTNIRHGVREALALIDTGKETK